MLSDLEQNVYLYTVLYFCYCQDLMDLLYCLREHILPALTPRTVCILICFFIFHTIKSTIHCWLLLIFTHLDCRVNENHQHLISETGSFLANHNLKDCIQLSSSSQGHINRVAACFWQKCPLTLVSIWLNTPFPWVQCRWHYFVLQVVFHCIFSKQHSILWCSRYAALVLM